MDIVVKYVDSAFEHGCTEADMRNAINTWLYDDIWDEAVDKHLLLGFDCRQNLLEIMYNVIDEQTHQGISRNEVPECVYQIA
jgi:hypothetical protein